MARRSPNAVVLLTQPVTPTDDNCFRCTGRVAWLDSLGVTGDSVAIMPRRVKNTYDEALALAEYQKTHPFRRVVVVTSPYHTRRALAVFTAVLGAKAVIGVEPASDFSPARPATWWAAAYDRAYVPYEWTALVWYAWQYDVNPSVAPSRLVAATNRGGR